MYKRKLYGIYCHYYYRKKEEKKTVHFIPYFTQPINNKNKKYIITFLMVFFSAPINKLFILLIFPLYKRVRCTLKISLNNDNNNNDDHKNEKHVSGVFEFKSVLSFPTNSISFI